jgi:hypothetical protein
MRLQQRESQVFELARLKIGGLSVEEIRNYANQYDFVSTSSIREVARKYFHLDQIAIGGILGNTSDQDLAK